jgi:cytochrome o ubiquinol oxidase subunit 2
MNTIAVLQPAGEVGTKERNLIIFCVAISAAIVIPVFGLLIYIATKYREGNPKAKYTPELGGSRKAETIWWLVPSFIMVIISIVTWNSSYALDPFKPLSSTKPTMHSMWQV